MPEPFGPMIACTSPDFTVRLTPLRISFGPFSVATSTCRSVMLSVDMRLQLLALDGMCKVNQDVPAVHPDRVDGDGNGCRQLKRPAGAQVEA